MFDLNFILSRGSDCGNVVFFLILPHFRSKHEGKTLFLVTCVWLHFFISQFAIVLCFVFYLFSFNSASAFRYFLPVIHSPLRTKVRVTTTKISLTVTNLHDSGLASSVFRKIHHQLHLPSIPCSSHAPDSVNSGQATWEGYPHWSYQTRQSSYRIHSSQFPMLIYHLTIRHS